MPGGLVALGLNLHTSFERSFPAVRHKTLNPKSTMEPRLACPSCESVHPKSVATRVGQKPRLLITHRANLRAVDGAGRFALKHAQLAQHAQVRAKLTEAMRAKVGQDQLKEGQIAEEDEDEEELPEADLSIQSLCLQSHDR